MPQAIVIGLFGATFAATTAGAIVTGLVGIGLSVGLNYAAQALMGKRGPKPEDVKGIFRQSAAARYRHLGLRLTGGHLAFLETENGNLHYIIVFGQGPAAPFETFYIDNKPVTRLVGWAQDEPYNGDSIRIEERNGTLHQTAFGQLVARFPTIWTNDHRLAGLACAHVMQQSVDQDRFSDIYTSQIVAVTALAKWGQIFDPRNGSTAFSANAALILRDYLTHADGARIGQDMIDNALFATAANVCDENVIIKAGGTIDRYHIGVSYQLDAQPISVIERILGSMDGRMFLTPQGKIGVLAGKWVAPTVTITDEHILDFDIVDGAGQFSDANEVIVKFTYAAAKYSEASADPWRDEDAISEQGQVRSTAIEAYEIQHHNHARRIAKIAQHRSSPRYKGTIVTTLKGLECFDQRWINISCADILHDGDGIAIPFTCEIIDDIGLNRENMTVVLNIQSFSSSVYDFNAATEEGTAPTIPDELEAGTIEPPLLASSASYVVKLSEIDTVDADGDPITIPVNGYVLQVSITVPTRPDLRADLQYKNAAGSTWLDLPAGPSGFVGQSAPLTRGQTYNTRGRYKATGGGVSAWVNAANVVIPA